MYSYNNDINNFNLILLNQIDDLELVASNFEFKNIEKAILEIHKIKDISASSYVELPKLYKKSLSILNIQNKDQYCFIWSILAHLYPAKIINIKYQIILIILIN